MRSSAHLPTPHPRLDSDQVCDTDDLPSLLANSARGDTNAFARLYDRTHQRIYALCLRVIRNPAHAEEATQEAYTDIWRHAARYDPTKGSALTWMLTIAHRKCVDRVRSAQAGITRDTLYHTTHTHPDALGGDTVADTVTATLSRDLDTQRVRAALGTLTALQREAIELAYFGGYTHTEVAGLLNIPLGTAKTRIRDGLIRLRDQLEVSTP